MRSTRSPQRLRLTSGSKPSRKGLFPPIWRPGFLRRPSSSSGSPLSAAWTARRWSGVSSLKDMLEVSLGDDPARHKRFAELYAEHRNDPAKLWEAVRGTLGEAAEKRLRLDGQLGYLTLNNAPLMRKLHAAGGQTGLTDIVSLAEQGYYRAEKWRDLIGDDAIPTEIPGETNEETRPLRRRACRASAAQLPDHGRRPDGEGG